MARAAYENFGSIYDQMTNVEIIIKLNYRNFVRAWAIVSVVCLVLTCIFAYLLLSQETKKYCETTFFINQGKDDVAFMCILFSGLLLIPPIFANIYFFDIMRDVEFIDNDYDRRPVVRLPMLGIFYFYIDGSAIRGGGVFSMCNESLISCRSSYHSIR